MSNVNVSEVIRPISEQMSKQTDALVRIATQLSLMNDRLSLLNDTMKDIGIRLVVFERDGIGTYDV